MSFHLKILIFQKVSECSRRFYNVPEDFKSSIMFKKVPKDFTMFKKIYTYPEDSKIFQKGSRNY